MDCTRSATVLRERAPGASGDADTDGEARQHAQASVFYDIAGRTRRACPAIHTQQRQTARFEDRRKRHDIGRDHVPRNRAVASLRTPSPCPARTSPALAEPCVAVFACAGVGRVDRHGEGWYERRPGSDSGRASWWEWERKTQGGACTTMS